MNKELEIEEDNNNNYGAIGSTGSTGDTHPTKPLLTETTDVTLHREASVLKKSNIIWIIFSCFIISAIIVLIIVFVVLEDDDDAQTVDWRETFLDKIDAQNIDEYDQIYSSKPHLAGTEQNNQYGTLFKQQLDSFGFSTDIEMTQNISNIWLSHFISSSLKQLNASNPNQIIQSFNLSEGAVYNDSSSNIAERHEAYFGYSPSTNIDGIESYLIYVNFASRQDFDYLVSNGYDLNGLIGIARFGGSMFRGTKVALAQNYGLIGLIIYNDPLEYGYSRGDVYPHGPWLPPTGYQRGSIIYGDKCPGNPFPPRILDKCGDVNLLPTIPAIPMGYGNAEILLSQLGGNDVPNDEWKGGLEIDYKIGGNNSSVSIYLNLNVQNDIGSFSEIFNVVGFIEGDKYQNESILIGNHRDAWIYGAADPVSGSICLLEIARVFGEMVNNGWKPMRNIYIASWDAEEWSLIGSTHFVEQFEQFVNQQLVAYINLDTAMSGTYLGVGASAVLSQRVIDKMKELYRPYNDSNQTLFDGWYQHQEFNNYDEAQPYPLGDGSDFVAFVNTFNIPSVDLGFYGKFGTYHSVYDSYRYKKIIDPDHEYHRVMAQYTGLIAMEFLENDLLPYNMTNLGIVMNQWLTITFPKTEQLYNCYLDESHIDLLTNVTNEYLELAIEFDEMTLAMDELIKSNGIENNDLIIFWNNAMKQLPKKFLYPAGLTGRKYFKNILVAPDQDNGYDSQVYPLIAHAIKFTDCDEQSIDEAVQNTFDVLNNVNNYLLQHVQLNQTLF